MAEHTKTRKSIDELSAQVTKERLIALAKARREADIIHTAARIVRLLDSLPDLRAVRKALRVVQQTISERKTPGGID